MKGKGWMKYEKALYTIPFIIGISLIMVYVVINIPAPSPPSPPVTSIPWCYKTNTCVALEGLTKKETQEIAESWGMCIERANKAPGCAVMSGGLCMDSNQSLMWNRCQVNHQQNLKNYRD